MELAELAGGSLPVADAGRLVERLGRGNEALARRALSSDETTRSGPPTGMPGSLRLWICHAVPRGGGTDTSPRSPRVSTAVPLTPVGVPGPEEAT